MSALIVYPPTRRYAPIKGKPSVFLAGSIEMGNAVEWQKEACDYLKAHASVIYNPRRLDWNSDWEQSIDCPEFNAQVTWELDMIDKSDLVIFYFDPATKSPITLMELGYRHYSSLVCCPEGYWRKGNVDIFCERSQVPTFKTLQELLAQAVRECQKRARD